MFSHIHNKDILTDRTFPHRYFMVLTDIVRVIILKIDVVEL